MPASASTIDLLRSTSPSITTPPTPYQLRVYTLLSQIPPGRLTTYASLARALNSSPRAIGGACRRNPFAPEVPCHRVISSNGHIGGYKGEMEDAPSGINQQRKLQLLREEGVEFTEEGMLIVPPPKQGKGIGKEDIMFDGPWKLDVRV
jgi:methylated-DNA-[protein]-cysteine S-methyltransferase